MLFYCFGENDHEILKNKNNNLLVYYKCYFHGIGVSEEDDISKTSESNKCDICHYWYFLNKSFKFQPNDCNRCHDLLMIFFSVSDITILNIKSADHYCIIRKISKNEAINLMRNADLTE